MSEDELIISLYLPSEIAQDAFLYIERYTKKIKPKLPEILKDELKRERFMLVGMYFTHRAFNHFGAEMTTDEQILSQHINYPTQYDKQLLEFKRLTGKEIKSTFHYLRMIRHFPFKMLLSPIFGREHFLYWFVMYGW